jgi:hypothetical protein
MHQRKPATICCSACQRTDSIRCVLICGCSSFGSQCQAASLSDYVVAMFEACGRNDTCWQAMQKTGGGACVDLQFSEVCNDLATMCVEY